MAINVTLGEVKTQKEKPFPKLMIGDCGSIIEVLKRPKDNGYAPVIVRYSQIFDSGYREDFKIEGQPIGEIFSDYNEPITIQNA